MFDMTDGIEEWLYPATVKAVTRQTVDFEPADVVAPRTIDAMIQPAQRESLKADNIDWSLKYITIHTPEHIEKGEYIEHEGEDYKIIEVGDYSAFGFVEALAEQTKQTKL